jgi:hypothetical protein
MITQPHGGAAKDVDDGKLERRVEMPVQYYIGITALGVLIGFLAGGSSTPVVGALLPLLFALVGGASGFYVAKANLTATASRARIAQIGLILTLFSAAVLLATLYGALLRTGNTVSALLAPLGEPRGGEIDAAGIDPTDAAHLIAIRSKLSKLGASVNEVDSILKSILAKPSQLPAPNKDTLDSLSKQTLDLYDKIYSSRPVATGTAADLSLGASGLDLSVLADATLLSQLSGQLDDDTARAVVIVTIKDLKDRIHDFIYKEVTFTPSQKDPELLALLAKVYLQSVQLDAQFSNSSSDKIASTSAAVNDLVSSSDGGSPAGGGSSHPDFAYMITPYQR